MYSRELAAMAKYRLYPETRSISKTARYGIKAQLFSSTSSGLLPKKKDIIIQDSIANEKYPNYNITNKDG